MAGSDMAKAPRFIPISTPDGFCISIPASMSSTGTRERKFFSREFDAEKFAKTLRGQYQRGERGGVISFELALDAARASKILEPLGMSLTAAAQAVAAQHRATDSGETFRERYLKAVREGEERWSARYSGDMGKLPLWVGGTVMDARCSVLTPAMLRAAVMENGAKAESTIHSRLRYVMAVFNHRPRYRKISSIQIMTKKQCRQMLRATESPEERRALALLLFAGIRPSAEDGEITRVEWDMVGKKEIYLPEDVTKTGSDRHITITPRLRRLIKGHPKDGPVIPANWRRVYRRLRQAAGLTNEQDITRHTFASHFLAAYDEKATKAAMGHTEGSSTLFRHYRKAVIEKDGLKYFGDSAWRSC